MKKYSQTGFTLVEALITIAVIVSLLGLALPSFQQTLNARQITAAIENITADLSYARSEAIKQNQSVSVYIEATSATAWGVGIDDTIVPLSLCHAITNAAACTIDTVQKTTLGSKFTNVTMSTGDQVVVFDSRGWSSANHTITVQLSGQTDRTITINMIGRIQLN